MATVTLTREVSWVARATIELERTPDWSVQALVELTRKISWELAPSWATTPDCPVDPLNDQPVFRRIVIDYLAEGGGRVAWELDRHFLDPGDYVYQLQASHAGVTTGDDWATVGTGTNVFFIVDPRKRMYGKTQTTHYRVRLTTDNGTYTSPVAPVLGKLDEHGWLLAREILRKEFLRHRLFSSVAGFILKARRYGEICSCVDDRTGEIRDANCPDCYGTGFLSGFYPPVSCQYADVTTEQTREARNLGGTGVEKAVVVMGRFLGFPELVQGDVFVARDSDERYRVHSVKEAAAWRSIPLIFEVELRRAPFTDVIYTVPLK